MEILGTTTCNLKSLDARQFWGYTADGYARGQTPRLGAILCYDKPGGAGHVAIVEEIKADGSIVVSESGYQSAAYWWTSTIYPPYSYVSPGYVFQGFIYNPAVDNTWKIDSFIKEAKSHIGEHSTKLIDWINPINRNKWTAAFVVACAKKVGGLIDVIIPDCQIPSEFAEAGIDADMGTFVKAAKTAKVGDIVLLRTTTLLKYDSRYDCDDIGIVTDIEKNAIVVVQGTSDRIIKKKKYKPTSKELAGYYRPAWSKVDNNQSLMFGYGSLGKFYDSENTEEDATIREVGYLSTSYKPTTKKSRIRLSVFNYTTMMAAFMDDLLVPGLYAGSSDVDVILDGIENKNARIIIEQLLNKGLNAAAAVGIAANIQQESGFNAAAVNPISGASGICQWTDSRRTAMINMAGTNWKNNLTGQIDYLWYELTCTSESGVMPYLESAPNTEEGARGVAEKFVRMFERCGDYDIEVPKRQKNASELWRQIVIQMKTTAMNDISSGIVTGAMTGKTVEIPSTVLQSGITGNYTYYDRAWANRTVQRQIYEKWVSKGKPQNRKIAVLDGLYLCAVAPIFGTTGDKVSVILEDGTCINCLLADAKGADAQSPWGHYLGGGVDIIEWEALVSHPSEIELGNWRGKKVKRIINGGKYQI